MRRCTLVFAVSVLAAVMVPAIAGALPEIPSSALVPSDGCGCHAGLLGQWRPSMHAQALTDPLYLHKLDEGDAATDGAVTGFCLQCHAPIGVMAGEVTGIDHSGASASAAEGVSCSYCHHVTGTAEPIGNASHQVSPEDVRRAQLKDPDPQAPHAWAYSQYHETAEFCGGCHNVSHPANGTHLEATYTEWKASPYAAEGITCQDCHMTPGPGVTKPNPGVAAGGGPERPHIYNMTFTGANVALGDAAAAEANLKAAATLDLEAPEIVASGDVAVKTTITNVGAGHYLPTGLTEVRQMWLEVVATDASGTEVLRERRDFGTVLKGADGSYPVEMWDAVGIQSDDRIPPRESTSNEYAFPMTDGPVTVTATLYYRSAPEEMAEAAGVDVPTTTMASATTTVYASEDQKSDAAAPKETDDKVGGLTSPTTLAIIGLVAAAIIAGAVFALRKRSRS